MNVIDAKDTASVDFNCTRSSSDPLVYRLATEADVDSLVTLINSSYRGELANHGWTNENGIVSGQRTHAQRVLEMINNDKDLFFVFFGEIDHILKGCVDLLHEPESKTACLNTFAVRPNLQGQGYGKFILSVAENYAVSNWNVNSIELKVMLQRPELLAYYNRRGYIDTGHHETFSDEQLKAGGALRYDLERCTLSKSMKPDDKKTI